MAYFDDSIRDIDTIYNKLMKRLFRQMEELDRAVQSGDFQGHWNIRPIKGPGARGYVAHGRFQTGQLPRIPQQTLKQPREPLIDTLEDEEYLKIYVELPGVTKDDIQLDITDQQAEIKARNFHRTIHLSTSHLELDGTTAKYNNGVLEVKIPKKKEEADSPEKKTIEIE